MSLNVIKKDHDVVRNYRWTLTNTEKGTSDSYDEVPYVNIQEYEIDESVIKLQWDFYTTKITEGEATDTDVLKPYNALFPRDNKASKYRFPYFSDVSYDVNSTPWASLDTIEQASKFTEGTVGFLFGQGAADAASAAMNAAGNAAVATLGALYPKVGIMDRPKLWQSHDYRTITIKFPLFNIVAEADWKKNRDLIRQIISNSLFRKRDFITGIPPVFYEIEIPGVHYSHAASLNNIVINNRGNIHRLQDGNKAANLIPDAYEVNLTFVDLVMPSRNLYQYMQSKANIISIGD
jgi:hypothetical protein